jgi:hypothetical protein
MMATVPLRHLRIGTWKKNQRSLYVRLSVHYIVWKSLFGVYIVKGKSLSNKIRLDRHNLDSNFNV